MKTKRLSNKKETPPRNSIGTEHGGQLVLRRLRLVSRTDVGGDEVVDLAEVDPGYQLGTWWPLDELIDGYKPQDVYLGNQK